MKKIMLIACLAMFVIACNNSPKEDKLPATDSTTVKLDSLNRADVAIDTVKKIVVKEKK